MPRVIGHLGQRGQPEIGLAQVRGGGARPRHVDAAEAGRLDEASGESVVGAGSDDDAGLLQHVAETGAGTHGGTFPGRAGPTGVVASGLFYEASGLSMWHHNRDP